MKYLQLLEKLNENKEAAFAAFQKRLIPTKQTILGVRTPCMRKIAKETLATTKIEAIMDYPDEYFEVTFIKLAAVSSLGYDVFVQYVEKCVSLIDNWATCDCFKSKRIAKHREEFLPVLERIFKRGGEYDERYVLVTLLDAYVDEQYLPILRSYLQRANTNAYYIHMAAAWLTAEILVKRYDFGTSILKEKLLDIKTHNKAIQKARESYRLTKEQKEFLHSLKIER